MSVATKGRKRLKALQARVSRARCFPENTCPASRHLHIMADVLACGKDYPMLREEPLHCAESILIVLESLFKARTKLQRYCKHKWSEEPLPHCVKCMHLKPDAP